MVRNPDVNNERDSNWLWLLVSTIQFVATLQAVANQLRQEGYTVTVPQGT
jgi:hypothetical protein